MDNSDVILFMSIYAIILGASLLVYLFDSIVTAIYAKKQGVSYYGLAFLPIGREYVIGSLAKQYKPESKIRRTLMGLAITLYSLPVVLCIGAAFCAIFFANSDFMNTENAGDVIGISGVFGVVAFYLVLIIIAILYAVFNYIAAYRIFTFKSGENGVIWLIVYILVSAITMPIFMLVNMNKQGTPKALKQ